MSEPYLYDAWYQAAFSDELDQGPVARTLLDVPLVIFRSGGRVVALHDRCPHRFAPLSKGVVSEGRVVCGYHGLAFDGDGRCAHNPHGPISANMAVRAFAIEERHSAVWVWMGDAATADPARIPDLSFIDATPETARIRFYIPTEANYRLVVDNLMDLSHADYLHPSSLGGVMTGAKVATELRDGAVITEWTNTDCLAPPRFHMKVPPPQRADAWTRAAWHAPAVMVIGTALVPTGAARAPEDEIWALHSITPETAGRSHYFVCGTRRDRTDDLAYSAKLREMLANAFINEDKPMLEAQQAAIGDVGFAALRPVLLSVDAGAMQVRRELDRRIRAQPAAAAHG